MSNDTATEKKTAQMQRFARSYKSGKADIMLDIERRVCGCDYGGTSWSTREEADRLARLLSLKPGRHLLEIGAGAGWPGLYLAKSSGCDLTLSDLLPASLAIAQERSALDLGEGGRGQHLFSAANAAALPFTAASFDAIVHSDVLCCLEEKQETLNECRRVIKEDGTMVFSVILTTPGLAGDDLKQALDAGPTFVGSETDYPEMIRKAGWRIEMDDDISVQYAQTLAKMIAEHETHTDALSPLVGEPVFSDRLARWRRALDALERDLLRRELYHVHPA